MVRHMSPLVGGWYLRLRSCARSDGWEGAPPVAEFYIDNEPRAFHGDPDAGWHFGAGFARAGVDAASLDESASWFDGVKNSRSLIVLRGGRLVYERYFHGSSPQQSNNVHSASKSMLQAVYGI